jgi:hypothetical protein
MTRDILLSREGVKRIPCSKVWCTVPCNLQRPGKLLFLRPQYCTVQRGFSAGYEQLGSARSRRLNKITYS